MWPTKASRLQRNIQQTPGRSARSPQGGQQGGVSCALHTNEPRGRAPVGRELEVHDGDRVPQAYIIFKKNHVRGEMATLHTENPAWDRGGPEMKAGDPAPTMEICPLPLPATPSCRALAAAYAQKEQKEGSRMQRVIQHPPGKRPVADKMWYDPKTMRRASTYAGRRR